MHPFDRMSLKVESVMNVSEGRNEPALREIAEGIQGVPEALLLHCDSDPDHNRSVFSAAGTPASIAEASLAAIEAAVRLIDMRTHRGVHPRIGAVDVLPFVPIQGGHLKECVRIAHAIGDRVAARFGIPVYFYGRAALSPSRRELANLRRGGFEALSEKIRTDGNYRPDRGPARLHPTAGAIAIGARPPLIAFNILLDSQNLATAKAVASRVREGGGGLPGLRALGFYLESRGKVQVSMNVTDYRSASLLEVFERVKQEARKCRVEVISSQIVGLVPQEALEMQPLESLHLESFSNDQILEKRIHQVWSRRQVGPPSPVETKWK